jgi:hypothetical protein
MLEEQLAMARAEAEAATAHAVLMARENLKANNLLNAKGREEGGDAPFRGAARCLTSDEGWNRSRRKRGRRNSRRRRQKRNGCRKRLIRKGGDKRKRNIPKRYKSDARYASSLGGSTRTLRRSDSRPEDVGVGAAEVEEEEEEVQASAD